MALTVEEMEYIKNELGRDPNPLEYGMLILCSQNIAHIKAAGRCWPCSPPKGKR